ncbi:NAD(P)-dependent glycerol-3-phosphate dehydrogenase [Lutimaribacter sp. EGI FJ00015]|uniref:NAD(P)-dependent glycerol-3-phosphate dehydrogenase n=1 Tax=Lutimaribacter degradans TaxID=2945989 RepID=A0ACC5ZW67_9RHOB|nr:NAD(P)H-dependent glycerol-3-phosphate dehydrogenase [Lutimaribacter sp. EGI FJ00013]MCM2562011.1 NAD(P)-dependent glycerol-3-phosphate dehydrogenase [Lutimaribacter sp. EGI FJ00013]MCO0612957.1 NAD(P)-dependent glycerol-3-phosphate dehydrogenase [Lutimaribacter sp. EGI FJ00015]MCO0635843.1 NAD(P)-dependent glycerol-3-phosphate dehydrogenase [Lutimaribacter sp. EGI FJ00014]
MICVAGAGAFGTALAVALAARGPVMLWARDSEHAADMQASRENTRRLPGVALPDNVQIITGFGPVPPQAPILLAVPMQHLRGMAETHAAVLRGHPLVACCKGVELSSGRGPTAILSEVVADTTNAILTGPSFAADIARGLPTALTLACADADQGKALQQALTTPALRLYRTTDTTGAELGGALKNVIAIAAGACIGLGMGDSARAALMTRGMAEITRLADQMGARRDTLMGLSGFGDLVLTCTSDKSRNYRLGLALGSGTPFDTATTVEGVKTAEAVTELASRLSLDMPISAHVHAIASGHSSVAQAMQTLLNRPLKEE